MATESETRRRRGMEPLKGRVHVPGENALLSALPPDERQRLRLERLSLGIKEVIYEPDGPIPHYNAAEKGFRIDGCW
jgi:hypothetical protein